MLTVSIDSSTFQGQLGVEGFNLDPLMTQHNDYEILTSKRPTRAPQNRKAPRCIVDYFHFRYLSNSYNCHSMFYIWDRKNVTQLMPSQVWKVVYANYKL